jgi:hypothetical protein
MINKSALWAVEVMPGAPTGLLASTICTDEIENKKGLYPGNRDTDAGLRTQ